MISFVNRTSNPLIEPPIDPSTPNAAEVQKILFHLELDMLGPYETPGNRLSRGMYEDLVMPWQVDPPVTSFSESTFQRVEWNRDGEVKPGESFLIGSEVTLDKLGEQLGTASMVTRWREAHPELVGTASDCVAQTISALREAMGGKETLVKGCGTVLLLFKKV
jgi:hypothetical protein